MKKIQVLHLLGVLCAAFLLLSGCDSSKSKKSKPIPVVHVCGAIDADTQWTADNLYVVDCSILLSATLTIEPGTIVKFSDGTDIQVNEGGRILADAQALATPIVFTSLADDGYGGDTNGDGDASAPAAGDWGYVQVRACGSVFDHCLFLHGGSHKPYSGTLILDNDCETTVTNCTFAHNQGGTPEDTRAATLDAAGAGAGTVIAGNVFYGNELPIRINGAFDVDDSNTFTEPAPGTAGNRYNGIFYTGYELSGDRAWAETEVPFVITEPIAVPENQTLTLGDGVVLKFASDQRLEAKGRLLADAATQIVFTSLLDDTVLGDTNGDADATAPAPGDWRGITFDASGSLLDSCVIEFAGHAKPYSGAMLVRQDSAITITNCTFAHNAGGTPEDNRAAALNLGSAAAGCIVTGNVFYDNDMPMVINGLVSLDDSNAFSVTRDGTEIGNRYNGIFMDGVHHTVSETANWAETEVPFVLYDTVLTIGDDDGATLTLADAVIVKSWHSRIDLGQFGNLNQGEGVYFTSLLDDARLGDTNGDGGTVPAKGDWSGVNVCNPQCAYADWANILYAANP